MASSFLRRLFARRHQDSKLRNPTTRRQSRRAFFEPLEARALLAMLYWQGDDGTNPLLWSVAANWNSLQNGSGIDQSPAANDVLVFDSTTTGLSSFASTNDIPGLTGIEINIADGAASDFSLALDQRLELAAAGISHSLAAGTATTISGAGGLGLDAAASITNSLGQLNISAPIDNDGFLLQVGGVGTTTISGIVSDAGGLTKVGAGTLALTNNNTGFSGPANITAGVLTAGHTGALGTGAVNLNGGTLRLEPTIATVAGWHSEYFNSIQPFDNFDEPGNSDTDGWDQFSSLTAVNTLLGAAVPAAINTRNDINIATTAGDPFGVAIGNDNLVARFTGLINIAPAQAGPTLFSIDSDDGSMLFVDGILVVNNNAFGAGTRTGTINLAAGQHEIMVVHYEGSGDARMIVRYDPNGSDVLQVVPVAAMQSAPTAVQAFGNNVTVSANSTIELAGNARNFTLGNLTSNAGTTLAVNSLNPSLNGADGKNLRFGQTNLAGSATTIAFNVGSDTDLYTGRLSDGASTNVIIAKQGLGRLLVDHTSSTADLDGTVRIDVQAGRFNVIGQDATVGENPINGPANAPTVQLSGGRLGLQNKVTTGNLDIDNAISLTADATIDKVTNAHTNLTGAITGNGNDLTINSLFHNLQFGGIFSGVGTDLTKLGSGGLVLANAGNSYTGTTAVNEGTLFLNVSAPALAIGALGNSASTVTIGVTGARGSAQVLTNGTITVGRDFQVRTQAAGLSDRRNLGGQQSTTATYNGTVILDGGETRLRSANAAGTTIFNGIISGAGSINKVDGDSSPVLEHMVVLNNANNSYTGATTVSGGTLLIGASAPSGGNGALGNATSNVVVGNGTLLTNAAVTIGRNIQINANGNTSNLGTNFAGASTFSGNIVSNNGGNSQALQLHAATGGSVEFSGVVSGNSNADHNRDSSLFKSGAGTVVLSGNSTYRGSTQVSAGTLVAQHNNALGSAVDADRATVVLAGASLELRGGISTPETLVLNGAGVGSLGALANGIGNNSVTGSVILGSAAEISSNSFGDLLTLGNIDADFALSFDGLGHTLVNGILSGNIGFVAGLREGRIFGGFELVVANPGFSIQSTPRLGNQQDAGIWGDTETWVYTGQIYDADGIFALAENIDDSTRILIDGVNRLQNGTHNVTTTTAATLGATGTNYAISPANTGTPATSFGMGPAGDGWHNIEIRFGNGTGGAGAVADATNGWNAAKGFGYSSTIPVGNALYMAASYSGPTGGLALVDGNVRAAASNSLTKSGAGTLTLANNNTYTGGTTVNGGTLLVNDPATAGSGTGSGDVVVGAGAILGGTGTVAGSVQVNAGGAVAPGASPGILNTGSVAFAGGTFAVEIDGTIVGAQYDQLNVTGTVALGAGVASLGLTLGYVPAFGDSFTILSNDAGEAVTGFFTGLDEGEVFVAAGQTWQITYQGGSGNDVVLRVLDPSNPAIQGTAGNDQFIVKANGANTEVTLNTNLIYSGAPTSLIVDGLAGNDSLTVDFSAGNPSPAGGITFHGGDPLVGPNGDSLFVTGNVGGTPFTSVEYDVLGIGAGTLTFAGPAATINFTGLEPATITSLLGTVTIDIDNGVDAFAGPITTTITDAGGGMLTADFDVGAEDLTFTTPSVALNILGDNDGNDAIIFTSLDAAYRAATTVNGQGGSDTIAINTPLTLGSVTSVGTLALTAQGIDISQAVNTTAVTTGSITLSGTTISLGANLSTDGANVSLSGSTAVQIDTITPVTIDTEAGNNTNAGAVSFAGTALLRGDAIGRDLMINTNTGVGFVGGAVTLPVVGNAGGAFLNDLTINTDGGAGDGVVTLTGNVSLDSNGADLSSFTVSGGGDVAIAATLTVDTENGNDANPGPVNWGTSKVYATAAALSLTINTNRTSGGGTGGQVNFGLVDNNAGANNFLTALTVSTEATGGTSGEAQLGGDIFVDGPINLSRRVVAMTSLTIDSKQSAAGAGNTITLGGAQYARGAGRDLTIDSSATAAGTAGGNVLLGDAGIDPLGAAGATFLNDLTINTSPGAGGVAGSVTIRNITFNLDDNGPLDAALFQVVGGANIVISLAAAANTVIDTEQGNTAGITDVGGVDFGTSSVSGNANVRDLTIDTSNTGAGSRGGHIALAAFGNAGGQFVNDLTLNTDGPAGDGQITLRANLSLDNNGTGDAALLNILGGGNVVIALPAAGTLAIDTEQGNTAGVTDPGGVTFGTSAVSAIGAGRNLTINTANTGAGSNAGNVTLAAFNSAGGAAISNLSIIADAGATRGDVTFTGAVGLDGNLSVNPADDITQNAAAAITTVGTVSLLARNNVTLNAATSAGASTVSILTNQDAAGSEDLVMNAGASITTTNNTLTAVTIAVNTAAGGTGDALLRAVSAGTVGGRITVSVDDGIADADGGEIVDAADDALANLTAFQALLIAASGIGDTGTAGTGRTLETAVAQLDATNSTSGTVFLTDLGLGLTLINLGGPNANAVSAITTGGGEIQASSPLTISSNAITAGGMTYTAADSPAVGDDLVIDPGVTAQDTTAGLVLNAGDDLTIGSAVTGALVAAATTLDINLDFGNADDGGDGVGGLGGGTLTIHAVSDLDAVSATIDGDSDNDTFNLRPDDDATSNLGAVVNTPLTINGNAPLVFPGDVLNLEISGLTSPTLTIGGGPNDGSWSFGNAASVTYTSIEDVNVTPALVCYGLILDLTLGLGAASPTDIITVSRTAADLEIRVSGVNGGNPIFTGSLAEIDHLTVLGTGDNDTLEILETAFGLPVFCEATSGPAGGHTSPTFTAHTGYDQAGGTPVDIHFDGAGGVNGLAVLLSALATNNHAVVYTSDDLDTGKSGNIGIGSGGAYPLFGARELGLSFENLAPLKLVGDGSTLTVDASSSPDADVTSLTIADDATPADGISTLTPNGGSATFEPVAFSNFAGLVVRSGGGSDLVDLASLDSAATLTQITLDADNLLNTDLAADTLRAQTANGVAATVRLLGGQGNDNYFVENLGLGLSIDGLAGQVLVSPVAGPFVDDPAVGDTDTLTVSDTGDGSGDSVVITEFSLEGITGHAGSPDIDYRNIDTLTVTATAGADTLDIVLNDGSDLNLVTVNGHDGNDQFYLNLESAADPTNSVANLAIVNLNGGLGGDTFGETPSNAPQQGTGLPALPLPPAPLPAPIFALGKGKIQPSQTTRINLQGEADNHPSGAASPVGNATAGNVYGPSYDLLNLDMTDGRPLAQSDDSYVVVSTVSGTANLNDPDVGESYQLIDFRTIEAINLCDQGLLTNTGMGDLYIRMTEGNDIVQFSRTNTPNVFRTRLNSLFLNLGATTKIVVYGRGGNDYIQMTTSTLAGGLPLKGEFYGEAGHDYLTGYTGDDLLVGGLGDDRLLAGEGNNELWGDDLGQQNVDAVGDGKDQLSAGSGTDRAYGGGAADTITLGGGNDYAFGGWGNDTLDGLAGHDRLYGGEGDDVLTGHDGNDVLVGNNGNDRLYGKTGDDLLIGGLGADQLNGEDGNDLLFHAGATYNGQTENSTSAGDLADAAMLALLNDWIANAINGSLLPGGDPGDAANIDHLSGGAGTDRAYRRQNDPNKDTLLEVETDLDAP